MKKTILLGVLFVTAIYSEGVYTSLSKCSVIKPNKERLECYDMLARHAINKSTSLSNWKVDVKKSIMDDSKTVTVLTRGTPISTLTGKKEPSLIIRCLKGKTELFVSWNTYMGTGSKYITSKIGDAEPFMKSWLGSADGTATFYVYDQLIHSNSLYPQERVIMLIKALMVSPTFALEAKPYNMSEVQTQFDLRGLTRAIEPLRNECGW